MKNIDKSQIEHQLKRSNKIANALNESVNFSTFFTLYKELERILCALAELEPYGIYHENLPSQDLKNLHLIKSNAEKALIKRFISFYGYENLSNIIPYIDEFSLKTCQYIHTLQLNSYTPSNFKARKPLIEENTCNFLSLQEIREYWKENPIQYGKNYDNVAKSNECLFYGKVLMLSAYEKAAQIREDNNFPCYFTYECHISKPKQLLISLIEEGYISEANDRELLELYTVDKLKRLAENIGCKKNGIKNELISRILQSLEDRSFLRSASNMYYSLSEKGIDFLQKNWDYTQLHKNWKFNISLFEYNNQRSLHSDHRFEEVAYCLLTNRIKKSIKKNELLGIQRDFYSLYKISLIKNDFSQAFIFYITSLYIATCCIYYVHRLNNDFALLHHDSTWHFVYSTSIAADLIALQKYYSIDIIDSLFNNDLFPPSFLSKCEFRQSIEDMFQETVFDYEYYNNLLFDRLEEYLDTVY